ncbi:MAG: pitrilysin family protein [Nitrospiraceae bacterium]|nr:pitrilysin family protein [Nitrospiraceae bacterium]
MRARGRNLKRRLILFAGILLLLSPLRASAAAIAEREVLPNGMVLLHAERTGLPIVKVVLAIKAGSVAEPPSKEGLANLTADLLNEGTTTRSSRDISDAIEFVGGSLDTSGGADYATVTLSVLKKDVRLGFDLLSDVVLHPAFSEGEIARKKAVIKSSLIQQKEDPGTVASKAFLKAVFGDHPYGVPPEGTEESLDAITRQDIVGFYKAHYAPNNAIIAVVGDIGREELRALLDRFFGGWQPGEIADRPLPVLRKGDGPKVVRVQKDITQANVALGHLGISREDPDYYAVSVMNYILGGGGFASRLMDNIRDNKGLSYDVHSLFSANKFGGYFEAGLQTKNESANAAIGEILKEMERIRAEPVTDKELSDAKSYLTGSFPLRIDSDRKIASFLAAAEYYHLGLDYVDTYKEHISAVTKEDVLKAAKKYLDPKDYVLVIVGNLEKASLKY